MDPPPQTIMAKAGTRSTSNYLTPADAHALVIIKTNKMGPQSRLSDNSTMYPQQVGHIPLELPPDST